MKDEYILGIESSCDETSMSILKNNNELLMLFRHRLKITKVLAG